MKNQYAVVASALSFLLWGFFPIYWKALQHIPSSQILMHRIVWSAIFLAIILRVYRRLIPTLKNLTSLTILVPLTGSALLISANWLLYIYAVNTDQVLEASLGYFLNPLLSIFLGMIFLKERLTKLQILAVISATIGVGIRIVAFAEIPWIAIFIALTFGFYGLIRKTSKFSSLEGLFSECLLLTLPAILFLIFTSGASAGAATPHYNFTTILLLMGAGPITAIPLLLFAYGARHITLGTVGILQYIAPTIQFLLAVFIYYELFTSIHLISFTFIWIGVILYMKSYISGDSG